MHPCSPSRLLLRIQAGPDRLEGGSERFRIVLDDEAQLILVDALILVAQDVSEYRQSVATGFADGLP